MKEKDMGLRWLPYMVLVTVCLLASAGRVESRSFGGPGGVSQQLEDAENPDAIRPRASRLQPYFDWKARLKEVHGLSFGLSAALLYQYAKETLPETEGDAFGGVYRFNGSWELFARNSGHPGRLEWRVESRSDIGGFQPPSNLGSAAGAAALNTGFGYSGNFDTDLTVLNWTQNFNDQRAALAIGRLAFSAYMDPYPFQTYSRAFVNRAFQLNPTIASTGAGALGAVGKGFVTDNIWVGGHIYDGNAVSGNFNSDTIKEGEFLYGGDVAWTSSIDRFETDRIQLTYWYKDERVAAGVGSGQGWAFTACFQITERWLPFLRWGHSDGGAGVVAEDALSLGFEYSVRKDQAWAIGAGWAKPSEKTYGSGLRDEYVIETSYRMQMFPSISLTPDVQLLINPAKNPEEDRVLVAGIRCIVNF